MFSNKEQYFVKYSKKIFSSVFVKSQGSNAMIDVLELYILINLFQSVSYTTSANSKTQHIYMSCFSKQSTRPPPCHQTSMSVASQDT